MGWPLINVEVPICLLFFESQPLVKGAIKKLSNGHKIFLHIVTYNLRGRGFYEKVTVDTYFEKFKEPCFVLLCCNFFIEILFNSQRLTVALVYESFFILFVNVSLLSRDLRCM